MTVIKLLASGLIWISGHRSQETPHCRLETKFISQTQVHRSHWLNRNCIFTAREEFSFSISLAPIHRLFYLSHDNQHIQIYLHHKIRCMRKQAFLASCKKISKLLSETHHRQLENTHVIILVQLCGGTCHVRDLQWGAILSETSMLETWDLCGEKNKQNIHELPWRPHKTIPSTKSH